MRAPRTDVRTSLGFQPESWGGRNLSRRIPFEVKVADRVDDPGRHARRGPGPDTTFRHLCDPFFQEDANFAAGQPGAQTSVWSAAEVQVLAPRSSRIEDHGVGVYTVVKTRKWIYAEHLLAPLKRDFSQLAVPGRDARQIADAEASGDFLDRAIVQVWIVAKLALAV